MKISTFVLGLSPVEKIATTSSTTLHDSLFLVSFVSKLAAMVKMKSTEESLAAVVTSSGDRKSVV